MFGIGLLVFKHWLGGILLLVLSGVSGWVVFWNLSRQGWGTLSGKKESATAQQIAAENT
jgi:hypothetical protein